MNGKYVQRHTSPEGRAVQNGGFLCRSRSPSCGSEKENRRKCTQAVQSVWFRGRFYRRDYGWRGVASGRETPGNHASGWSDGEEVGAERVEADVEARCSDFGAGARIRNVVKPVEEVVLQG